MATVINLDASRIQTIHNELVSLDSSLVSNALPELEGIVGNISDNVQNDKMHGIITRMALQISSISTALKSDLNRLEEFLETQISRYNTSNQNAIQRVTAVINRMENYATANGIGASVGAAVGSAVGAVATGANAAAQAAQTPAAEAKNEQPGFWEYHGNNFAGAWDYSRCDAGLDYLGATLDGVIDTVGAAVNFVVDGVSEILGWIVG